MTFTRRALLAGIPGVATLAGSPNCTLEAHGSSLTIVGDSLSIGLAAALKEMRPDLDPMGLGVVSSGLSSPRFVDWPARIRRIATVRPAFVLVMLGMNDSGAAPSSQYIAALGAFLTPLAEGRIPFAVISIPSTDDPVRNRNIAQLNTIYERTTPRFGGRFVRLPPFERNKRSPDGVHFIRAGYRDLATSVLAELRM